MDSLFDLTFVPVKVTINKLNFFPNRKMPRFVSGLRQKHRNRSTKNQGGNETNTVIDDSARYRTLANIRQGEWEKPEITGTPAV